MVIIGSQLLTRMREGLPMLWADADASTDKEADPLLTPPDLWNYPADGPKRGRPKRGRP
jgi:hypothetical protein